MADPFRECPMCGETMRKLQREVVIMIPGTNEEKKQTVTEWVCRECDYFEEAGLMGDEEPS